MFYNKHDPVTNFILVFAICMGVGTPVGLLLGISSRSIWIFAPGVALFVGLLARGYYERQEIRRREKGD